MRFTESDLNQLEQQVEDLIRTCATLRNENNSLKTRQAGLIAERGELIDKAELARARVEAMISRLKAMEEGL